MTPLARLRSFLRSLARRRNLDREMDAELRFHIGARTEDLVAHGADRADAERQARRELGDLGRWKELGRESRGVGAIDRLLADLRYGVRSLRRSPVFALSAILSIA